MLKTSLPFFVMFLLHATAQAEVTFDWATVGNPGNAPDSTGFGAVAYNYRIAKMEVTNAQYAEFLNAVDPTSANALSLSTTVLCPLARQVASISTTTPRTGRSFR